MEKDDILDQLNTLISTEYDAVRVDARAMDKIEDQELRGRIQQMQDDHERHAEALIEHVTKHGGEPPERQIDFRGVFMDIGTMLTSQMGASGALRALERSEKYVRDKYESLLLLDWPPEIKETLEKQHGCLQQNVQTIERELGARTS